MSKDEKKKKIEIDISKFYIMDEMELEMYLHAQSNRAGFLKPLYQSIGANVIGYKMYAVLK